jgi:hypothetical protein
MNCAKYILIAQNNNCVDVPHAYDAIMITPRGEQQKYHHILSPIFVNCIDLLSDHINGNMAVTNHKG